MMKPILFSMPMVQAILEGKKSQTRRVVKPQPQRFFEVNENPFYLRDVEFGLGNIYPKYQIGDILYVQETWKCIKYNSMDGDLTYGVEFKDGTRKYFEFDDNERFHQFGKFAFKNGWQSPYFMPREAARLFLRVRDVRVERLQDIAIEDICNEGIETDCRDCISHYGNPSCFEVDDECGLHEDTFTQFEQLWDSLSGKEYPWESNPRVWVITFERTEGPVTP